MKSPDSDYAMHTYKYIENKNIHKNILSDNIQVYASNERDRFIQHLLSLSIVPDTA